MARRGARVASAAAPAPPAAAARPVPRRSPGGSPRDSAGKTSEIEHPAGLSLTSPTRSAWALSRSNPSTEIPAGRGRRRGSPRPQGAFIDGPDGRHGDTEVLDDRLSWAWRPRGAAHTCSRRALSLVGLETLHHQPRQIELRWEGPQMQIQGFRARRHIPPWGIYPVAITDRVTE
jgi:hypothetical protein